MHVGGRKIGVTDAHDLERAGTGAPQEQPLRNVTEEILRRIAKLPKEAFEGLPPDGASQHDHYIYRTPKRADP
jgi:hypothetical protein